MSKDYKQGSKRSSSGSKSGGGSVLTGLFIGLCLGIAIAVAAALYINRIPNPFASKPVGAAPAPQAANKPAAQPEILAPGGASKPTSPAVANQEAKRFDFYTMLPESGAEPKSAAQRAKPADAVPPATVEPAKGSYLQVGAFQNETDADNLKAKLALMGVEANIQTSEVGEKGVMHRVRIGPLASAGDIDRLRAQLKLNGLESSLVKQ